MPQVMHEQQPSLLGLLRAARIPWEFRGRAPPPQQRPTLIYNATCKHICMHACMCACMHAYVLACMRVCMHAYIMHMCLHACVYACMHACVRAFMHMCLHACVCACMHTCMHACMHACITPRELVWPSAGPIATTLYIAPHICSIPWGRCGRVPAPSSPGIQKRAVAPAIPQPNQGRSPGYPAATPGP